MGNICILKPEECDIYLGNFGYEVEYKHAPNIFTAPESCELHKVYMCPATLSWYLSKGNFGVRIYSAKRIVLRQFLLNNPNGVVQIWKGIFD